MKYRICLFIFALAFPALAQKKNNSYNYYIKKTTLPIKIDGRLNDEAWIESQIATSFRQVLPMDTSKAWLKTEVRLTYDEKNLYVSFINYNSEDKKPYIVESLKRDFAFLKNDNVLFFIDPFNDLFNGFAFGSNAMGGQWDALLNEGGMADLTWENKWISKTTYNQDHWIWEASIPFKTLRYKKDTEQWGINFSRLDLKTTEKSVWAPVPRQFPTSSLAFTGNLIWDSPPPAQGENISFIPYLRTQTSKNYAEGNGKPPNVFVGGDVKLGLTSSLNMDLTFNPDFSQVEVDRQQINLDRFELFFPERRQFFIENGDLFNNFGFQNLRPFFSRRIGLNAPISNGLRVSGKLNKDWRVGLMNMSTKEETNGLPIQNFTTFAVQRRVFSRSNIAAMLVNKLVFNKNFSLKNNKIDHFNRNLALEYNLASADNLWKGKFMYLHAFSPEDKNDGDAFAANLVYNTKHWNINTNVTTISKVFDAEVGFVPRTDYTSASSMVSYLFFPKHKGFVLSHGPTCGTTLYYNQKFTDYLEDETFVSYKLNFRNTSSVSLWGARNYTQLQSALDPTNYVKEYLASGTSHQWLAWGTEYASKPQSLFTYALSSRYGGYYADGRRLRLNAELGYRFQPYVALTASANFNRLRFFENESLPTLLKNKDFNFWLISPRIDITFTDKIFLSGIMQYNNQINNTNLNIRFQWRYRPASDLFIVYTDNYDIYGTVKNRAVVLKLNYWWNI